MSNGVWRPRPGEPAYLVPVTPTAPAEAYCQPPVEVVSVAMPLATVALADGRRITTSARNVRRAPLAEVAVKPRTLGGRVTRVDPKHGTELTFDFGGAS